MKNKSLSIIFITASLLILCCSILAYEAASIHGPKFIEQRTTSDKLKGKLNKAELLIETEGVKSFNAISKMNDGLKGSFGIFVIDPESGELLVSPPKKSLGEYPLISKDLNGKVLAREIIKSEVTRKNGGFINELEHAYGLVYENYFAKLAIAPVGKLYVVAIGRNSAEMQKLIVVKLVNAASDLIRQQGVKEAVKEFNKKDGLFRYSDTYIFVYVLGGKDKGLVLCNPNFPQDVGMNLSEIKTKDPLLYSEMQREIKALEAAKSAWLIESNPNPVTGKISAKALYLQKASIKGITYAVGSGVYFVQGEK